MIGNRFGNPAVLVHDYETLTDDRRQDGQMNVGFYYVDT